MALSESPGRSVVLALLLAAIVALIGNSHLANAAVICPQLPANADGLLKFCATNSYGSLNVSRPEFENWNCNHPYNKYTQNSNTTCPAATGTATAPTCTSTCDQNGPTVCAHLPSPSSRWPNAFTSAVFANTCQLTQYNCLNPTQQYVVAPQQQLNRNCTSIGFGI